jgi:general stress protein YciG
MNGTIERDDSRKVNDNGSPNLGSTRQDEMLIPDRPPLPFEEADTDPRRPRPLGFGALPRQRVREIASKGGKAAHAAGTAHKFTRDEARVAGRKGGLAAHTARRKTVERSTGN